MNANKPSNTLEIIGLILGIIAIIGSFIPCLGTLAFIPGLIGLILGVIGFLKAKDNGYPKGMAIAVIAVSLIACAISVFQIVAIGNMASDIQADMKEYESCEELKVDYDKVKEDMAELAKEMEDDSPGLSSITKMAKLGSQIGHMKGQSEKLDCGFEMEEFDPSDYEPEEASEETMEEDQGEAEGDAQSSEEGN